MVMSSNAPNIISNFFIQAGPVTNLNQDYSGAPVNVSWSALVDPRSIYLRSIVLQIRSPAGTPQINTYGSIPELTNGLTFTATLGGVSRVLTEGRPIRNNMDLERYTGGNVVYSSFGAGDDLVTATWDLVKMFGAPLWIEDGSDILLNLSDDLTGLTEHFVYGQGYLTETLEGSKWRKDLIF